MQGCANSIANALELPQSSFSHWQMYESSIIHWYHSYCCLSQSLDEIVKIYNLVFSTGFSRSSILSFDSTQQFLHEGLIDEMSASVQLSLPCHAIFQFQVLTHLPLNKMAAILQTTFSWMKMVKFWFNFHWNLFLSRSPIGNKSTLVQVMACRLFGAKPLP